MKLIDNSSKTNWNFVVIVVVLGLVFGSFALWYVNSTSEEVSTANIPKPTSTLQPQIDTSDWQTYRNEKFGFEVKYPPFFRVEERTPKLFRAGNSLPYEQSYERFEVEVAEKPLVELEYIASDGIIASSIFKFLPKTNQWEYVSTIWGESRPEDGESFRIRGGVPEKHLLHGDTTAWVGNATDIHSTFGGRDWETAYIESPASEFTIKIILSRCRYVEEKEGCALWPNDLLTDHETIFTILSTFRFVESSKP